MNCPTPASMTLTLNRCPWHTQCSKLTLVDSPSVLKNELSHTGLDDFDAHSMLQANACRCSKLTLVVSPWHTGGLQANACRLANDKGSVSKAEPFKPSGIFKMSMRSRMNCIIQISLIIIWIVRLFIGFNDFHNMI